MVFEKKVCKKVFKKVCKKVCKKEGREEGIQFGSLNLLSKMIRNKQLDREQSEEYLRELGMDQEAITKFLKDSMD